MVPRYPGVSDAMGEGGMLVGSSRDQHDGAGPLGVEGWSWPLRNGCQGGEFGRQAQSPPGSAAGLFCRMSCRSRGRIFFDDKDADISKQWVEKNQMF